MGAFYEKYIIFNKDIKKRNVCIFIHLCKEVYTRNSMAALIIREKEKEIPWGHQNIQKQEAE